MIEFAAHRMQYSEHCGALNDWVHIWVAMLSLPLTLRLNFFLVKKQAFDDYSFSPQNVEIMNMFVNRQGNGDSLILYSCRAAQHVTFIFIQINCRALIVAVFLCRLVSLYFYGRRCWSSQREDVTDGVISHKSQMQLEFKPSVCKG